VRLGKDDGFAVAEWDRTTRSMMDGLAIMNRIHAAGATIVVLDRKALDLTTPIGKGLLSLLSAVFEEERVRIRSRALKGIAEAKRRNKRFGRKPKPTAEAIRERIRQGDSYREIARTFHVHHQTIARVAKRVTQPALRTEADNQGADIDRSSPQRTEAQHAPLLCPLPSAGSVRHCQRRQGVGADRATRNRQAGGLRQRDVARDALVLRMQKKLKRGYQHFG
jgi:hypothetical protein